LEDVIGQDLTKAPASRCHWPPSLVAAAVNPAPVEPMPVVITDLEAIDKVE